MTLVCALIYLEDLCLPTDFQELKEILIPLPVGCSLLVRTSSSCLFLGTLCCTLQAILDTCHSGTMLDLPHHHCNSVWVPWQSKGERRTMTMQNINGSSSHLTFVSYADIPSVRRQATDFANSTMITSAIEGQSPAELGESRPADQRELSPGAQPRETRRPRERMLFANQTRYASPEARFVCDGWCEYSDDSHPTVVSTRRLWLLCTLTSPHVVYSSLSLPARTCRGLGRARTAR
jgi:hypothetical protein